MADPENQPTEAEVAESDAAIEAYVAEIIANQDEAAAEQELTTP